MYKERTVKGSGGYTLHEWNGMEHEFGKYDPIATDTKFPLFERSVSKNNGQVRFALVAGSIVANLYCTNVQGKNMSFSLCDSEVIVNSYIGNVETPFRQSIERYSNRRTKDEVKIDILSFKSLENSWDGYRAVPAQVKSAANAMRIADKLSDDSIGKISDMFPNPNGTVSFQWENSAEEIISLEVGDNTFSYYVEMNSLEVRYFNNVQATANNVKELDRHIRAI